MDLEAFGSLLSPEGQRLLTSLPAYDESAELRLQTRLRADHPAGLVAAALAQSRLRRRARVKFGRNAERMYFTAAGLEQATRASVAKLRARRFAAAGIEQVADLCSGVGGDALALAEAGLHVTAVDHDPIACAVLAANADVLGVAGRITVRTADVTAGDWSGFDAVFIDPARRDDVHRKFDPEAYSPAMGFVLQLRSQVSAICVKVAPGISHGLIPEEMDAEWVSESGEVKEASLWNGRLAKGTRRRATLLPSGAALELDKTLAPPEVKPPGRWLYEPDGAVIRAHLVREVAARIGGWLLDPSIAYICSDHLMETPFATAYEVLDTMPFQLKRLRAALRERQVGSLTVKKRGFAMDPHSLRRAMQLTGDATATIVITRHAGSPIVLFVRRNLRDVPSC